MAGAGIDASKLAFVLQYFDTSYIRTPPGMLKIAQLVSSDDSWIQCVMNDRWSVDRHLTHWSFAMLTQVNALIGFICAEMASEKFGGASNWFGFVAMTGFWVTLILLVFYMLHLLEKLLFIPWPQAVSRLDPVWLSFTDPRTTLSYPKFPRLQPSSLRYFPEAIYHLTEELVNWLIVPEFVNRALLVRPLISSSRMRKPS